MDKMNSKRMMVILAHPDDESFGMGGTLAKYSHQGAQVILLCATRGEAGIPGVKPDEAMKIREQEVHMAAKQLGIEVYFLDYLDGNLAKADQDNLLEYIACWIYTVDPQVILTFGPDGISGHPDHVTISNIATRVVNKYFPRTWLFYLAPSEATVLGCGVSSSNAKDDERLVQIDISEFKIEKIRAIQSHVSQHPPLEGKAEDEVDNIPCHEYFSLGQKGVGENNTASWFEGVKD